MADKPSKLHTILKELVHRITDLTGFTGEIRWDTTKPDGQPRRCLDTTRAYEKFRFRARVDSDVGLKRTIEWYRSMRKK